MFRSSWGFCSCGITFFLPLSWRSGPTPSDARGTVWFVSKGVSVVTATCLFFYFFTCATNHKHPKRTAQENGGKRHGVTSSVAAALPPPVLSVCGCERACPACFGLIDSDSPVPKGLISGALSGTDAISFLQEGRVLLCLWFQFALLFKCVCLLALGLSRDGVR